MTTETFKKLTDYQHARARVEMYLGSRELTPIRCLGYDDGNPIVKDHHIIPAAFVAYREIIDNAVDEVCIHGHGNTIKVDYDGDTLCVEDNGRGIPIHEIKELGKGPAATILLSTARAGRNFDNRGAVIGVNGLGAAVANFVSEWFDLEILREKKHFHQQWKENPSGAAPETDGPKIKKVRKAGSFTKIRLKLSDHVFKDKTVPVDFIRDRIIDLALSFPKTKFYFNGELIKPSAPKVSKMKISSERLEGVFELMVHDGEWFHHAIVNGVPVFHGGAHIREFDKLAMNTLIEKLNPVVRKALRLRTRGSVVTKEDIDGVLVRSVSNINDAQFDGQMKSRLSTNVASHVKKTFNPSVITSFINNNPEWVERVIERCKARVNTKELEEIRKNIKKDKTIIPSLTDATSKNREQCILFVAEGMSAISGVLEVRNPEIHGGIGLFGKIMNVYGVPPKRVMESKAVADIIRAIGLEVGIKPDRSRLRYGKIHICTDEDKDGFNITTLLVNLFYQYWPDLFKDAENPFIYKMMTPLLILEKDGKKKYVYSDEFDDFDPNKHRGWNISRAKGLGRLSKNDWQEIIKNPRLVPVYDDGNLKEKLALIFDPTRADDRKEWLLNHQLLLEKI